MRRQPVCCQQRALERQQRADAVTRTTALRPALSLAPAEGCEWMTVMPDTSLFKVAGLTDFGRTAGFGLDSCGFWVRPHLPHGASARSTAALSPAHELTVHELQEEATRFRKYVRWLIELADDAANTEYDEEVSQVMIYGGIYISPADTLRLCDGCTKVLNLVLDSGHEQRSPCPTSASASSAA